MIQWNQDLQLTCLQDCSHDIVFMNDKGLLSHKEVMHLFPFSKVYLIWSTGLNIFFQLHVAQVQFSEMLVVD